ncbi:MAG: DUF2313 domain-containing protein [Bacillota bacterium]|nr:DUF2313 domain-containing protein [Bacillota bacterium]
MPDLELYLPDFLREDYKPILQAQQPELAEWCALMQRITANRNVDTADEEGIEIWERILGINPKGTDTLEDRRFRIRTRLFENLPYTMTKLRETLDSLAGPGMYTIQLTGYELTIRVSLRSENSYNDVQTYLNRVLPANIAIDLSLLYNSHAKIATLFTHTAAAAHTHAALRAEVID